MKYKIINLKQKDVKKFIKNPDTIKQIIVGSFSGVISGLFAAGGGMIVVPALIHIFKLEDNKARATSIFSILPMVITSGIFYYKNNYVDWNIGIKCAIGGIAGGFIGAKLLKKLSTKVLRILFIIFLIYTSIKMIST